MKDFVKILFDLYIYGAIAFTLLFILLKCQYNITYFDEFLYLSDEKTVDNSKLFYFIMFHIVFYFTMGLIFRFNDLWLQIIQTIFVEFAILYGEKCTMNTNNYQSAILSILIGLISYIIAGILMELLDYL